MINKTWVFRIDPPRYKIDTGLQKCIGRYDDRYDDTNTDKQMIKLNNFVSLYDTRFLETSSYRIASFTRGVWGGKTDAPA